MLKGCLAVCSQFKLGLITSEAPKKVTYPDGTEGEAWTGIMLSEPNIGGPWSSRNPIVLGAVEDITNQVKMIKENENQNPEPENLDENSSD